MHSGHSQGERCESLSPRFRARGEKRSVSAVPLAKTVRSAAKSICEEVFANALFETGCEDGTFCGRNDVASQHPRAGRYSEISLDPLHGLSRVSQTRRPKRLR